MARHCSATPQRAAVVALAREWLGTPYHHQASRIGVGVDCIGLVRGVWRALYSFEPQVVPGYSRDWAEATGEETLLEAARRHLVAIDPSKAIGGDVLVFRYRPRMPAKHAAILGGPLPPHEADQASALTIIHAVEGAPVAEVPFAPWWRRRVAGAFSFPGIED